MNGVSSTTTFPDGSSTIPVQSSSSASSTTAAHPNWKNASTTKASIKNLTKWDINQTVKWLRRAGFGDCERYFVEHKINGRALLMLDEDDMKEVVRTNVGQRKNLYHLIKTMQVKYRNYVHSSSFEDDNDDSNNDDDNDDDGKDDNDSENESSMDYEADDDKDDEASGLDVENAATVGTMKNKTKSRKKVGDEDDDDDDGGDEEGAKTSDDGERLLKNSSFIRNKVKLGSGLGLRNRSKPNNSSEFPFFLNVISQNRTDF